MLWEYLRLGQTCTPMDAIVALGSDATRVADRAAELWHEGYGKYVIVSGGQERRSTTRETEAAIYARILQDRGVPVDRLIIESRATNTGENIAFVKKIVEEQGYPFRSFVLVQKPYMERRVYATFRKVWPEAQCVVTSPDVSCESYARDTESRDRLVHYLVGTLYRIQTYPRLGFQIEQEIPADVASAFVYLCERGYTQCVPVE